MANELSPLLQIAIDLTRALGSEDRYARLLAAVRAVLPCDATAVLALRGRTLVPLATYGLLPQVMGMRFSLDEQPRLAQIVANEGPVRFPADSKLPDPFDGLVEGAPHALHDVHDCLGCPLIADGRVVGVLTADALAVRAFDPIDKDLLVALGALAGAALHTAHLIETVETLAERRGQVVRELSRRAVSASASEMLGVSAAMERLRNEIATVARTDLAVLIAGETGVGKELVARAVHEGSERSAAPLIYVNCAALPESVVESELFGHTRGAFTGATSSRMGKFEVADGGTLFLDEVGELPLSIQPKLLRALQEGEIQRIGSDEPIHVDVRIVAATNRVLQDEITSGRFRADLYHRLNVFPVIVPALRERREDIGVLSGYFLDRYRARLGLGQVVLAPSAAEALRNGAWPGNVRELDHVLARATLRASVRARERGPVLIELADLGEMNARDPEAPTAIASRAAVIEQPPGDTVSESMRASAAGLPLRDAVDEFKRATIARALNEAGGNWAQAARELGVHRSNLHHLARRLKVKR